MADYLDRADLTTHIADWINDARLDIALKYNFKYLYVEATCSTSASTATYAFPSDYLGHETIWCGSKKLMKAAAREYDELTETDVDAAAVPRMLTVEQGTAISISSIAGPPDYYIPRGMEFELYPLPDTGYTLKIKYYCQPSTFSVDADYDYISTFHYETIIWGACLRGAIFMDDEEAQTKYAGAYEKSVQEMMKRERDFELEDQHPRMKDFRDFDLHTFKRLTRITV